MERFVCMINVYKVFVLSNNIWMNHTQGRILADSQTANAVSNFAISLLRRAICKHGTGYWRQLRHSHPPFLPFPMNNGGEALRGKGQGGFSLRTYSHGAFPATLLRPFTWKTPEPLGNVVWCFLFLLFFNLKCMKADKLRFREMLFIFHLHDILIFSVIYLFSERKIAHNC